MSTWARDEDTYFEESESDEDQLDDDSAIDPNVFQIRNALHNPTSISYTAEELHVMIHEGEIDMDPPYQRGIVWSSLKQEAIIDSLFHNYYIPPIVFAITYDEEDGTERRLCVDGKQRLTSIQKFFDGQSSTCKIAYRDPETKKAWYYTNSLRNKANHRSEIPPKYKRLFAALPITCVEYRDLGAVAEREVFQRVQLGMTLTTAEKLQAISSPRADWVTQLDNQYVSADGGLADCIEFDESRGRKFQNVAHLAYCCDGLPDELVPTTGKLQKWLSEGDEPSSELKAHIVEVLGQLCRIASDDMLNIGFTKVKAKVSPVEFLYIGVLLFVMADEFSIEEQADAILIMRREIRKKHKDVRLNTRVGIDCWKIIDSLSAFEDSNWREARGTPRRRRGIQSEYPTPSYGLRKRKR